MVAEEEDDEPEVGFKTIKVSMKMTTWGASPGEPSVAKRQRGPRGKHEALDEANAEIKVLKAEIKRLNQAERAADGEAVMQNFGLKHDLKDIKYQVAKQSQLAVQARHETTRHMLDVSEMREEINTRGTQITELTKKMKALTTLNVQQAGQLKKQIEIAIRERDKSKEHISPTHFAETQSAHDVRVAAERAAREVLQSENDALQAEIEAREIEIDELKEAEEELATELQERVTELQERATEVQELHNAAKVDRRGAQLNVPQFFASLKIATGIKAKSMTVPARTRPEADSEWWQLSVKHVAAVLEGRGEGDDINIVAEALHRAGYLKSLVKADRFQPITKSIVKEAVAKVESHWTARLSVHIWDRCELSRSQMETLRHLLSFVFNPVKNVYERLAVWVNPKDPGDVVDTPKLVGRQLRERMYQSIASSMNIEVGASGRCERDAIECTSRLYSNYASALRQNYSLERPAQPILFLDGTGGPLGRGVCHGEMGCADFVKVGDSDAKQSRATLQPVFAYVGNDHAEPLRANLDLSIKSYNKLVRQGTLDRVNLSSIPARPITVGDMQGAKSTYGMRESCHAVWCKCRNDGHDGAHHAFASRHMDTYGEMMAYIDEVGCVVKTYDEMCAWAHYSPGVALGGAFTPFKCSCCDYEPTEEEWYADLAAWHAMDDEEQKAEQKRHADSDDALNSHLQHYHQVKFMPPMPHHGMDRCGVDNLHLTYLNVFKHMFKYTVHDGLPPSKKILVSQYLKDMKFYSYDAASLEDDPVSHWIGREVKRFIDEADVHLPFLLQIAAAPPDCDAEMAACANGAGEQAMEHDPDDPYAPTVEELAAEEELLPTMMKNAQRWDNFLAYCKSMSAEWPQGEADTDTYRKGGALEAFNLGNLVAIDIHELKPTMLTWVPHIMCFIVPRQLVELGDASRRSADACESFGAMFKKLIKHATCRRPVSGTGFHLHGKKVDGGLDRRWVQTFRVGFIQQAFTRACVRESLQHGEENARYRQRVDVQRTRAGKATRQAKYNIEENSPAPKLSVYEACASYEAKRAEPSLA